MSAQARSGESLPTVPVNQLVAGEGAGQARPWNLSRIPGNSGVLCLRAALLQSHDGDHWKRSGFLRDRRFKNCMIFQVPDYE